MDVQAFQAFFTKIHENVSQIIIGKKSVVELLTVSLLCKGHVLLEDVPGVGKTMMAKTFAHSLNSNFTRIQFTPDLLPSDLTGIHFYNQKIGDFEFRPGPLFSNIVLADEINRATPRTQSSLLEAMEESQITVDGVTGILNQPFMVIATENPVESYGTYPLPEAQLDRFMMRIHMGYPTLEEEKEILTRCDDPQKFQSVGPVTSVDDLELLRHKLREVHVSPEVMNYLLSITTLSRSLPSFYLGVSPRGSIALFQASKAYAAISGRDYVIPEDVKYLAPFVLNHRIKTKGFDFQNMYEPILDLLGKVEAPVEER